MQDAVLYFNGRRFKFKYIENLELSMDGLIHINGAFAEYDEVRDVCYTYAIEYTRCNPYDVSNTLETLICEVDAENSELAVDKFKKRHPDYQSINSVTQKELINK